jgi:hypothetical protein
VRRPGVREQDRRRHRARRGEGDGGGDKSASRAPARARLRRPSYLAHAARGSPSFEGAVAAAGSGRGRRGGGKDPIWEFRASLFDPRTCVWVRTPSHAAGALFTGVSVCAGAVAAASACCIPRVTGPARGCVAVAGMRGCDCRAADAPAVVFFFGWATSEIRACSRSRRRRTMRLCSTRVRPIVGAGGWEEAEAAHALPSRGTSCFLQLPVLFPSASVTDPGRRHRLYPL